MKKVISYLKYSGVWVGVILNPYHWRFAWSRGTNEWPETYLFENCIYIGPIYIRVIIDDGSW